MSTADEVAVGKQVMAEVRRFGLLEDESLRAVGERLQTVMERQDLPWRFWVVEEMKGYNAFAVPGGFVFVTRAYYEKLNDDEAAFVLGHEMAHIDLRHHEKQAKRSRTASLGSLFVRVLMGVEANWGAAVDIGATAYVTHYSRVLEREADFAGYGYAERAGYNAAAAVSALSKLGKEPNLHPWIANIYATHPILSSREDRLAALGGQEPEEIEEGPPAASHRRDLTAGLAPFDPSRRIAVRILAADGGRWENRWRKSFTRQLHLRLIPLGFEIAGDDLMYKPDIGDPVAAARSRDAQYVLLVTMRELHTAATAPEAMGGTPVRARIDASARLVDAASGEQLGPEIEFAEEEDGLDVLAADPETLYVDAVVGRLAEKGAGEIAIACARAAGATAAPPHGASAPADEAEPEVTQ